MYEQGDFSTVFMGNKNRTDAIEIARLSSKIQ